MASAMAALAAAAAAAVRPGERRHRRQSTYRPLHVCWGWATAPAKPFRNLPWQVKKRNNNNKEKGLFEIIKQWIILYTMGNKRLWDHSLVFHLLTGDIFTAGYHADGMDPCVCGSIWLLWMFHRLRYSSPLYWCICTLMGADAVKIIVHDASILCVQLIIHKACVYVIVALCYGDTGGFKERKSETKWDRFNMWTNTERTVSSKTSHRGNFNNTF